MRTPGGAIAAKFAQALADVSVGAEAIDALELIPQAHSAIRSPKTGAQSLLFAQSAAITDQIPEDRSWGSDSRTVTA
jgi:hypothetical protein